MPKVLISDKLSPAAAEIFRANSRRSASVPWISLANLLGRPQPRVACAGKLPRLALVR